MGSANRYTFNITTDASGDATVYSGDTAGDLKTVNHGDIASVRYVKTDFTNNVTVAITGEDTGTPILALTAGNMDVSLTRSPRAASHDVTGAAALYASGGEAVNVPIPIHGERIKIVIAAGGDTKTGTIHITTRS